MLVFTTAKFFKAMAIYKENYDLKSIKLTGLANIGMTSKD
jgi:hypothetical protein